MAGRSRRGGEGNFCVCRLSVKIFQCPLIKMISHSRGITGHVSREEERDRRERKAEREIE